MCDQLALITQSSHWACNELHLAFHPACLSSVLTDHGEAAHPLAIPAAAYMQRKRQQTLMSNAQALTWQGCNNTWAWQPI